MLGGVFMAGVFLAVGEDGDNDRSRFLFDRAGGEGAGHFEKGAADGIDPRALKSSLQLIVAPGHRA